jgi:hypothetical protein
MLQMNKLIRLPLLVMLLGFSPSLYAQTPQTPVTPQLSLEDQFERRQDLKQFRGNVVVLMFGDRTGMKSSRELGERLHVQFHPDAKGQSPEKAINAPVIPVSNSTPQMRQPDVKMIPVACIGKVPGVVQTVIRNQFKKEVSVSPVWLDFNDTMKDTFGMQSGEPNLVVIDAQGRLRFRAAGKLDEKTYARLVQVIDYLRKEELGIK